ncbi:MAG: type IV secretion system DNA-binding domain-containing protein [bacterium]|nr:type IV secretion system DNA-binding domain-containing protein [bacterium]
MNARTEKDLVYMGRCDFRNRNQLFGIKRKDRRQHMYVVGKTGTGKSTFLHNLVVQDIENGEGLCVVDPHGELVESVLAKIPASRKDDIIYFNPADSDWNVGFNPLEIPDPKYKHLIASGLMSIFTKLWANVWSARMEYILNNAILALADTPGSTLLGINRIMVDKDFRQSIVANVKDPVIRAFWIHEYEEWRDQFRNEAIAPIQNKVGQFLSTSLIRNIVGQEKSTLDIFKVMNEGKILLINLSKGKIGEDNSALLGSMLITKIQLAAMERVRIPEEERVDFYLYVDEFQNFATDSFANILSEARKYRLNLVLAHQYTGQLVTDTSTKVRDAVFGNAGTMVMFRVGAIDAEFLEPEFEPEFLPEDMVNLPNYCVYLKLMVDGITSRPFSAVTLPPFRIPDTVLNVEEIIENSRRKYARPRETVEEEISSWSAEAAASGGTTKVNATCDVCGKGTTLNFEPTPGKPIYCFDCLKKVKEGKIAKIPEERDFKREKAKFKTDLSNIGIDIEEERKGQDNYRPQTQRNERNNRHQDQNQRTTRETNREEMRGQKKSVIDALEEKFSEIESDEVKQELTLGDLTPQKEDRKDREKKSSSKNVEALRKNLREALTKHKDS